MRDREQLWRGVVGGAGEPGCGAYADELSLVLALLRGQYRGRRVDDLQACERAAENLFVRRGNDRAEAGYAESSWATCRKLGRDRVWHRHTRAGPVTVARRTDIGDQAALANVCGVTRRGNPEHRLGFSVEVDVGMAKKGV